MIKFWWRSGSGIRIRIRLQIVTLVRHALAEVCTVPVVLVVIIIIAGEIILIIYSYLVTNQSIRDTSHAVETKYRREAHESL